MARAYAAKAKKLYSRVEGAEEVIKLLEDMGKDAEYVLSKAAEAGGKIALAEARRRCPVKTGRLKESLELKAGKKSTSKADVQVSFGKKEYYGTFVELGTKRKPARPFLRPSVDENKQQIREVVMEEISKAIGRT